MLDNILIKIKKPHPIIKSEKSETSLDTDFELDSQQTISTPQKIEILNDIYEQEIIPTIKILKPEGVSQDKYEAQVLTELRETVEFLQNQENRTTASPEESIEEMEKILLLKAHEIIERYDRVKYGKNEKKFDKDLVKKAKICLLANNDFSDWNKKKIAQIDTTKPKEEFKRDVKENINDGALANYLDINTSRFSNEDGAVLLNAAETDALLKSALHDQILQLAGSYSTGIFSEISDHLCQELLQENKRGKTRSLAIETFLRDHPDKNGYSEETMKSMVRKRWGKYVMDYPQAFSSGLSNQDWKYIMQFYAPEYPYHLNDTLASLQKANLSEEREAELIDYAFKHNFVSDKDIIGNIKNPELREKYKNLNEMPFIYGENTWQNKEPENLEPENMKKVKELIGQGYMGMFYDHNRGPYLSYLAEHDYEWLKNVAQKYEQENLLLRGSGPQKILKPEDQARYAEKLLSQNEIEILAKFIDNGSFDRQALPAEIFWDLMSANEFVNPKFFNNLDENCFNLYKNKKINFNDDGKVHSSNKAIFDDIENFKLDKEGENKDYYNYQQFITKIKNNLKSKALDVLYTLDLDFKSLRQPEILKAKEKELQEKFAAIEKVFPNYTLEDLAKNIDFKFLNNDLKTVEEDLDSIEKILNANPGMSINLEYLPLMRYKPQAEKISINKLLSLRAEPINKLLTVLESNIASGQINDDLKKSLKSDFGVNVEELLSNGALDTTKLFEQLSKSVEDNCAVHIQSNNNLSNLKDSVLKGEAEIKNNDYFVRIAKKYLMDRIYDANLHSFDVSSFSVKLLNVGNFNEKNWGQALMGYILSMEEDEWKANKNAKEKMEDLFAGPYRDVCLGAMNKEWQSFLNDKNQEELPFKLSIISETIDNYGGAGNLSKVESLGGLIHAVKGAGENKNTALRTKLEIKDILASEEARFEKDKWSQDDKAEFYDLAKEIIEAAPSLFSAFKPIFEDMNAKEMKSFLKEMLPLYQMNLITLQESTDDDGGVKYNARDLVAIKNSLEALAAKLRQNPDQKEDSIKREKEKQEDEVRLNFKNRLGLLKVPENINQDGLRSLHNFIRYTGNINGRDKNKEALISFYLALQLNGDWEKFRCGEKIDVNQYLAAGNAELIKENLKGREKNNLPLETLNLKKDLASKFQTNLQAEVSNNMVGNIETVDVKLGNIKRNIDELLDPDVYDNPQDKALISILEKHHKGVGTVLAKTFQILSGRNIDLSPEEKNIQQELSSALNIGAWSQERVKNIQERIQPLSLIDNLVRKMDESEVEKNITELNRRLQPNEKVIEIFNRLDENFKTGSGAMAISRDLEYLENLAIKEDGKITPAEKQEIQQYLSSIREKMAELEKIMDSAKEYFNKIKGSAHAGGHIENIRLNDRILEIEKIINSQGSEAMIASQLTKDPNLIIENMRQCLGCLRKEINNDTNLAFGDYNKFFIMSKKDKNKGSVADEIVFFVPTKNESGEEKMSFVMDRIYGTKSSDILIAHALTVYKKYRSLREKFPEAKISISISTEAMSSAGVDAETLRKRLIEKDPRFKHSEFLENLMADVPKSSFSDNYLEFGSGGARKSGERKFSALVIE